MIGVTDCPSVRRGYSLGVTTSTRRLRLATPPLGGEVLAELLAGATVAEMPAHSPILRTGGPVRAVAVLHGLARVFIWAEEARRQVTMEYAGPGQLIGLTGMLVLRDELGVETVTASTVAIVSVDHVRAILTRHPETAWPMIDWAAARTVDLMCNIVDGIHGSVRQRVCRHLLDLSTTGADGRTVAPVTHRYLAEAVGTAREVATRTLGELAQLGLLATAPGHIVLLDPERLRELASRGPATAVPGPAAERGR